MTRRAPQRCKSHAAVGAQLKAQPNIWQRIGVYRSNQTAKCVAYNIRRSYRSAVYEPAGAYEAHTQIHGDDTAVIARYIGTPGGPHDRT